MENFNFYNPTRIVFGRGAEGSIGEYVASFGIRKILLTYGSERIKKEGLYEKVVASLLKEGVVCVSLGGVVSNPVLSKVQEGIVLLKEHGLEGVLSVGGGSVLDSAKAMAAGAVYDGDVWDFFEGKCAIEAALPIFSVMTLAATGSEMNGSSVVTNEQMKQKYFIQSPYVYPKVSIINPQLMATISREYLAYSAVDIIAHCLEGYFTASVHPMLLNRQVEAVILTVIETTEKLLKDPGDYDARAEFAWTSTCALNGQTFVGTKGGTFPNHMIEHSLSALYSVPHGAGLSVVMLAWMKWYHYQNPKQFARFAQVIFGKTTALEGIEALEAWFLSVGTPTRLSHLYIRDNELQRLAQNAQENARYFGLSDIYTQTVIEEILVLAL